jgi:hypothetical protein
MSGRQRTDSILWLASLAVPVFLQSAQAYNLVKVYCDGKADELVVPENRSQS